jgi:type IV pilus assembly protein PilC
MDQNGAETEGKVDADNQAQADKVIRENGYTPIRVTEVGASSAAAPGKPAARTRGKGVGAPKAARKSYMFKRGIKPKQLMVFTRQLATLIEAGLPLLRGLRILLKQE